MEPCKETLLGALKRECKEEIGTDVEVEDLEYVREYITDNYPDSWSKGGHLVDFIFRISVPEGYDPSQAPDGDSMQVEVKWMRVSELKRRRFYPRALLSHLEAGPKSSTVYLGDVTWAGPGARRCNQPESARFGDVEIATQNGNVQKAVLHIMRAPTTPVHSPIRSNPLRRLENQHNFKRK